jgi:hypothetical protein
MSRYTEMVYGWCLSRVVHFIVAMRLAYPLQKLFLDEYDLSDAYRRVAHVAKAAAQSILVLNDVAYIALRLSFGGAPNPPTWCSFSEMVTDLSNEILSTRTGTRRCCTAPTSPRLHSRSCTLHQTRHWGDIESSPFTSRHNYRRSPIVLLMT